ncbi:MAG: RNA-binding S4 domain-containing protein [Candidatus Neomarinimicrobiota bacterium]
MEDTANEKATVRLDRWLWAARLTKTRGEAARACQAGKVKRISADQPGAGGRSVKPGRAVSIGDEFLLTRRLYKQHVRVAALAERRVPAKIAATLYIDLTPQETLDGARAQAGIEGAAIRQRRQAGRPSKRDRRALQNIMGKF